MTFDLIVPVYNTNEVFLKECFDSIFALNNKNFKVTVVNDCSTRKETIDFLDNLKKIYSEYSDKILIINNQVNKKLSGARNVGFENSSNDLVWFIDSDDTISRADALDIIEKYFTKYPDLDILSFPLYITDVGVRDIQAQAKTEAPISLEDNVMLLADRPAVPSKVFSRKFLTSKNIRHNDKWFYAEDVFFLTLSYARARKIMLTLEELYYYRTSTGASLTDTNTWWKQLSGLFENTKLAYEKIKNDNSFASNNFHYLFSIIFYARISAIIKKRENFSTPEYKSIIQQANEFRNSIINDIEKKYQSVPHTIPLVYATDGGDIDQLEVSIFSLLTNADKNTIYQINILCKNIAQDIKQRVLNVCELFNNKNVLFIDCEKYEKKYDFTSRHLEIIDKYHSLPPIPTFYRLFLPEIFPNIDRIIYLDTDTLIQHDLTLLFNEYIKSPLGMIREVVSTRVRIPHKYFIPEPYIMYNAGIILFNNKLMKKKYEPYLWFSEIKKYSFSDQSLLNYEFSNDITRLDLKYNLLIHLFIETLGFDSPDVHQLTMNEKKDIFSYAHIIHYTRWNIKCKPTKIFNSVTYDVLKHESSKIYMDEFLESKMADVDLVKSFFDQTPNSQIFYRSYELWGKYWLKLQSIKNK